MFLFISVHVNDVRIIGHCNGLTCLQMRLETSLSNDEVEIYLTLYVLLYADDTIMITETPDRLCIIIGKHGTCLSVAVRSRHLTIMCGLIKELQSESN